MMIGEGDMTNHLAQVGQLCSNEAGELYGDSAAAQAMAAGLTDHVWSVEELLSCVLVPNNT